MNETAIRNLRGIITPLVTPLADRNTLDRPGFEGVIEHVLAGGVSGIFLLGSTGEAASLPSSLRDEVIRRGSAQIGGRVPVLVGITDTCFDESIRLAGIAIEAGADALVVAPPYYYTSSQREFLDYLERLTAELPLPFFLYNIPSCTRLHISPDTVAEVAQWPGFLGVKDSSGNMVYFHKVREVLPPELKSKLLVGPEELLAEALAAGADGGVCGGSNLFPRLHVAIYNAVEKGDFETAFALHRTVMRIHRGIYAADGKSDFYLKGLKCALSLLGICSDRLAEPFSGLTRMECNQVKRTLAEVGLLSGEEDVITPELRLVLQREGVKPRGILQGD